MGITTLYSIYLYSSLKLKINNRKLINSFWYFGEEIFYLVIVRIYKIMTIID
jgi:hypothetical protein